MKDRFGLGVTTPLNEDCIQVSKDTDYLPKMRAEAQIFIGQLKRQFKTKKVEYRIKSNYHEFGIYLDIELIFEEEDIESAENIENNLPEEWDEIASIERQQLDLDEVNTDDNDEIPGLSNGKETHVSLKMIAHKEGYDSIEDMILEIGFDSVVPSCCSEGCQCEPDGKCEHSNKSVLIEYGII